MRRDRLLAGDRHRLYVRVLHLGFVQVFALLQRRHEACGPEPADRLGQDEIQQAICIACRRSDVELSAQPGTVCNVGQRSATNVAKGICCDLEFRCYDPLCEGADQSYDVDQVANRQADVTRMACYDSVEADTDTIAKVLLVASAGVDGGRLDVRGHTICERDGGALPVGIDAAGLGEVISRSGRDQAQGDRSAGCHDAVERLIDAAVTPGNDDACRVGQRELLGDSGDIAGGVTDVDLRFYAARRECVANSLSTPSGATATRRGVQDQWCRSIHHAKAAARPPMLQCAANTSQSPVPMLELGVKFLISYLLGSLMGSLLVGSLRGGVDIRDLGSGNAGGTNALRTQGAWFALAVVVIDVGKGIIAAGLVPVLSIPGVGFDPAISREWLAVACAAAAVIGHVWPVYHRFRGGKGAATLIGTLMVLSPGLVLVALVVFATVLVLTGFVGLSTMSATAALPVWVALTQMPAALPVFAYTIFMAVFIVYCHRSNINRMLQGTENRNPKVMLMKPRPGHDES